MINFPATAFDGQLVVVGATTYRYSSSRGRWMVNYVVAGTGTVVTPALFSDQATTSTGYFDIPNGTTAQRPVTILTGQQGTGGTSIYSTVTSIFSGTSIVHIFTATGTSYFTATANISSVAYLVVAGGGSGGSNSQPDGRAGGGGAGGLVTGTFTATVGVTYAITVGAGGLVSSGTSPGNSGQFSSIT